MAVFGEAASPTGKQWYVNPASVPGLIGELIQFEEQNKRRKQHAAAGPDTPEKPLNNFVSGIITTKCNANTTQKRSK